MKKILLFVIVGALIISGFGASAINTNVEKIDTNVVKSQNLDFTHTVLGEYGTGTWCGYCHYAHLRGTHSYLRENITESCLTCHDLPIQADNRQLENVGEHLREAKIIHGGKQGLVCASCHTPHGSDQSSLLRPGYPTGAYELYSSSKYALCWQCHNRALTESVQGTGMTRFRDKKVNLHRIHVVELRRGRACHICHEPHASNRPHLLRARLRFGTWNTVLGYESLPDGGSCQTPCHRDKEYRR